jgi:hypothetical protein
MNVGSWHHPDMGAHQSRVRLVVLTGSFQTLGPLRSRTRTKLACAHWAGHDPTADIDSVYCLGPLLVVKRTIPHAPFNQVSL